MLRKAAVLQQLVEPHAATTPDACCNFCILVQLMIAAAENCRGGMRSACFSVCSS